MISFSYPSGNASFPRSYITRIVLSDEPGTVNVNDTTITLTIPGYPHYVHRYVINEKVFMWNSNVYSLDYVVTDGWYEFGDSTHHDFGATLKMLPNPTGGFWYIEIAVPGSAGIEHVINLPHAPDNYWIQAPRS
jgi:hypothetical protein